MKENTKRILAFAVNLLPLRKHIKAKLKYEILANPMSFALNSGTDPKDFGKIIKDMRHELRVHGIYYQEYVLYDFMIKPNEERRKYIGECERYRFFRKYNDRRLSKYYSSKCHVYQGYKEFFKRPVKLINSDGRRKFMTFIKNNGEAICKIDNGSMGEGVYLLNNQTVDSVIEKLTYPALIEKRLYQYPPLSKIQSSALSTLRMLTLVEGSKRTGYTVKIISPFVRFSRDNGIVDNGGSGGILVSFDKDTGTLASLGCDESGRYYRTHPDTGVEFEDTVLPEYEKAKKLCHDLALVNPELRLVGWDIAYNGSDYELIEANMQGQFIGQQLFTGIRPYFEKA